MQKGEITRYNFIVTWILALLLGFLIGLLVKTPQEGYLSWYIQIKHSHYRLEQIENRMSDLSGKIDSMLSLMEESPQE